MSGRPLSIRTVGQLFGLSLPEVGGRCRCPFKKHAGRKDPTFRVYAARLTSTPLYKCHRAGQRVVMFDGTLCEVEKIAVGDQLMGPDGLARTVGQLTRGRGSLYEVRPARGDSWYVNEDHVLSLATDRSGELQKIIAPVREWLKWPLARQKKHYLYHPEREFEFGGDRKELPIEPYFLGLMLGDGMMLRAYTPGIRASDPEIQKEIYAQAEKWNLNVRVEPHPVSPMHYFAVRRTGGAGGTQSNPLADAFDRLGLRDARSATKFIPEAYLRASMKDRFDLLAGIVDTDGALQGEGRQFRVSTTSKAMAYGIAFVARSLGLGSRVVQGASHCQTGAVGVYWRVSIAGRRANLVPLRVARKRITRPVSTSSSMIHGLTVHPSDLVEDFYGFGLDGDALYMLDDFTVTHNCWSCEPPDNTGDSVALYAKLGNMDRKDAWKKLKDDGFDVPGADEKGRGGGRSSSGSSQDRDREAYQKEQKKAGYAIQPKGSEPKEILPLDYKTWQGWSKLTTGALEKFAAARKLPLDLLREMGMIDMPGGRSVGFTYFDPATGAPCRVKVRGVAEKMFWCEPKGDPSRPGVKALAPLYMAHLLRPDGGPVTIVEGEIDALTLAYMGIPNVVSLPDGSESAKTVNLKPLTVGFTVRLVASDHDKPGNVTYRTLVARSYGQDNVRLKWHKMTGTGEQEDIVRFKDANDALKDGGFTREDFVAAMRVASSVAGYEFDWSRSRWKP